MNVTKITNGAPKKDVRDSKFNPNTGVLKNNDVPDGEGAQQPNTADELMDKGTGGTSAKSETKPSTTQGEEPVEALTS